MLNAVEALRAVIFLSAIFISYGYVTGLVTVEEFTLGLRSNERDCPRRIPVKSIRKFLLIGCQIVRTLQLL